ncbi:MAG: GNAT family N-acetyltransferase [Nitrospiraceae bacterium]|nr:GNAT family N-acetyltransferase [Nitrospiraceae bacterium]
MAYQIKKAAFRTYVEIVWGWNETEQRQHHEKRFAAQEFHVIQASGTDVGILAIDREFDYVKVNQLFILPECQNRGIGKACMTQVIADARKEGLPVRLRVLKANPRAVAFYRRLGFSRIADSDTHVSMEWKEERECTACRFTRRLSPRGSVRAASRFTLWMRNTTRDP